MMKRRCSTSWSSLPERNGRTGSALVAVCWKVFCKSRNAWQMMMSCCCWNSFFTDRTRRNYWKNYWNGRSRKPLSLLRAQLYTTQRLVHCVLRRLLAGGLWFSAVMVCSKSYRGRYASPALAAASYPFVDLPSGDTLRCKLFPADKFYKISLYFDGRIKYNEVND